MNKQLSSRFIAATGLLSGMGLGAHGSYYPRTWPRVRGVDAASNNSHDATFTPEMRELARDEAQRLKAASPRLNAKLRKKAARKLAMEMR